MIDSKNSSIFSIPNQPGTYLFNFAVLKDANIRVGKLANRHFLCGSYAYFGSALGPGGLQSRLKHHLNINNSKPHWHIDYLKPFTQPSTILFLISPDHLECQWRRIVQDIPGIRTQVSGFGSSDCQEDCPTHLLYLGDISIEKIYSILKQYWEELQIQPI